MMDMQTHQLAPSEMVGIGYLPTDPRGFDDLVIEEFVKTVIENRVDVQPIQTFAFGSGCPLARMRAAVTFLQPYQTVH